MPAKPSEIVATDRIRIRPLRESDLPLIAATDGGPAWNAAPQLWACYLEEQNNQQRDVLLAMDAHRVLAYITLVWDSSYAPFREMEIPEINNLVVAAAVRRQGIGGKLIAELETIARAADRMAIGLGVGLYADYGSAQRLYARLGYRPDGRGITYHDMLVLPGDSVIVDDDLIQWLIKPL